MGYLIAALLVIAIIIAVAFALRGRGQGPGGQTPGHLPSDHPVSRADPAADEPTPGASDTTTNPDTVQRAQEKTPPS